MPKPTKMKATLAAGAVLAISSFAIFGIANTIYSYNSSDTSQTTGAEVIDAAATGAARPDGSICNPAGCAGCSGCVSLQYAQSVMESESRSQVTLGDQP